MAENCLVCGGSIHGVFSVSIREAARHFVLPQENRDRFDRLCACIERLWNAQQAQIVICESCGFRHCDPLIGGDSEFYNLAYDRHGGYPTDKWDYDRTLRAIADIHFDAVVEIGSGPGHFLKKIAGRAASMTAYEYDESSRPHLEAMGAEVIQDDFRKVVVRRKADAVFMFQVLEHLTDPKSAIRTAAEFLNSGGHVFITVPNAAQIAFQERSGSLLDMPPNHVSTWTSQALRIAGEESGLTLTEFDVEPFSPLAYVKEDIVYSFLRKAQKEGSLAAWVRQTRKRSLMAAAALLAAPARIGWWLKAGKLAQGDSIWAHFVKT